MTAPYLPDSDSGKADFLANFAAKLPAHAALLGVTSDEQADAAIAASAFPWALAAQTQYRTAAQQWTAFKNQLRDGPEGPVAAPSAPALPPKPATLADGGIFARIGRLVRKIKAHAAYTEAIGRDLGIVGAEDATDPAAGKPAITARLAGGRPEIVWRKGRYDALEIEADRGDGKGFAFLTIDTVPDYADTAELPAAPAIWKYRAIYRKGDERVGQWSDTAQITVHA